jgi:hypothetical protein
MQRYIYGRRKLHQDQAASQVNYSELIQSRNTLNESAYTIMIREVNLLISLKWLKCQMYQIHMNSEWMLLSVESTKRSEMTRGCHDMLIPITFPTLLSAPTVVRWRLGVWVGTAVSGIMIHAPGVHETTVGADGIMRMTRGMGCITIGQSRVFTFDAPSAQNITLLGLDSDIEGIRSLQSEGMLPCSSEPPRQVAPKVESEVIVAISISWSSWILEQSLERGYILTISITCEFIQDKYLWHVTRQRQQRCYEILSLICWYWARIRISYL